MEWQRQLPTLAGSSVLLRQIRTADAASLLMLLGADEVARYIPPPPATMAAFVEMIQGALDRQRQGRSALFAVVAPATDVAVGIVQIRFLEGDCRTAEWGVALGAPYWGRGLFTEAAAIIARFAFETMGVERLEARSRVDNARANAAFRKIGAVLEGVLRQTIEHDGRRYDQCLWSILAGERRTPREHPVEDVPEAFFEAGAIVH
jgi:ribosomal-protein-alanine N-acetyltransferase